MGSLSVSPLQLQLNYEADIASGYIMQYGKNDGLSVVRRSTDDPVLGFDNYGDNEAFITDLLGSQLSFKNYGTIAGPNIEMPGESPFADSLVTRGNELVGKDTVREEFSRGRKVSRRGMTCADFVCDVFTATGLGDYLAKGPFGVVSSSNDFIIDNLSSDEGVGRNWIDIKNTGSIAAGDWVILNVSDDNPTGNYQKHSYFISGVKKYHYEIIHDAGYHKNVEKKIVPKNQVWRSAVKIFRLYPEEMEMYKSVLDDDKHF